MLRLEFHSHGSYVSQSHVAVCNQGLDFETMAVSPDQKFQRGMERRTASAAQTWFLIDQTDSSYSAIT